ncbi:hypothetical protein EXU29_18255 [Acinetobacter wuhouensis]|jgi:hypothetical protein|uniref:hypothetical protein n=1 Tax=Acinetobacter wuhouensis TaxID=1879050 RepID=UPI001023E888|nr:hypothetical protein [Acinetobacter wuhouensis]RZG67067.1 hypothetical protein EXU29_18255 [Acinetobacter wuhouensis]
MKLLGYFMLLASLSISELTYADMYENYDADGNLVSLSSSPRVYDESSLEDQYVFLNKDSNAVNIRKIFSKSHVMKVGDTYIFNESLSKFHEDTNENFRFEKIITVEEQLKNKNRAVRSIRVINDVNDQIKRSNVDETEPRLIYKPYAVITKYSLLNKSKLVVQSWTEKSSMQFLTLKECNTVMPQYKQMGTNKMNATFFVKSQLLTGKVSVSCLKIDQSSL